MGTLAKTLRSEKPLQRSDCQLTEMRFFPNADRLHPGMKLLGRISTPADSVVAYKKNNYW